MIEEVQKDFLAPDSLTDLPTMSTPVPVLGLEVLSCNTNMLPGQDGVLSYSYTPQFKFIP